MEETGGSVRHSYRRARAAALLLATFAAGAVTGYSLAHRSVTPPAEHESGGVRVMLDDSLPLAFQQLHLTAQQHSQVIGILARARPKTDSTLRSVIPRLRALTDSVDAEIRAVLRPDQRAILSTMRRATDPLLVLKRAQHGAEPSQVDTIVPRNP